MWCAVKAYSFLLWALRFSGDVRETTCSVGGALKASDQSPGTHTDTERGLSLDSGTSASFSFDSFSFFFLPFLLPLEDESAWSGDLALPPDVLILKVKGLREKITSLQQYGTAAT